MLTRPKHYRPTYTLPWRHRPGSDAGMSTAEYAIGTIAAAAFGAILYTVVTGDSVVDGLTALIQRALSVNF
jgi:hypothetical protein